MKKKLKKKICYFIFPTIKKRHFSLTFYNRNFITFFFLTAKEGLTSFLCDQTEKSILMAPIGFGEQG